MNGVYKPFIQRHPSELVAHYFSAAFMWALDAGSGVVK